MRAKKDDFNGSAEKTVKAVRRAARQRFAGEEKIGIVLQDLRGEESLALMRRQVKINLNLYFRLCKEFLEPGKKRMIGASAREVTLHDGTALRTQRVELKSLKEAIDMESSAGKLIFQVVGPLAEFQGAQIRERTLNGLEAVRACVCKGGRRKKLDGRQRSQAIDFCCARNQTVNEMCEPMGISRATRYAYDDESARPPGVVQP